MNYGFVIPEPFLFNPLKHHLGYIREFIAQGTERKINPKSEIKLIGTSVMDVYKGVLSIQEICSEMEDFLVKNNLYDPEKFSIWAGREATDFRIIKLPDDSIWTLKYNNSSVRFVHFFPARYSTESVRIKSNTMKSAILYIIYVGKDFITAEDLNSARSQIGLSPVKSSTETEAITGMIELLRVE